MEAEFLQGMELVKELERKEKREQLQRDLDFRLKAAANSLNDSIDTRCGSDKPCRH
jgi:hypothetical protein